MKYIIKNCPAYMKYNKCLHNGHCDNITDCLLKRIVEESKADIGNKNNMFLISRYDLASKILELLEIEECENE